MYLIFYIHLMCFQVVNSYKNYNWIPSLVNLTVHLSQLVKLSHFRLSAAWGDGSSSTFLMFLCLFLAEHLNPINVKIAELREALESVTAEQKYLKARDARHRRSKFLSHSFFFSVMHLGYNWEQFSVFPFFLFFFMGMYLDLRLWLQTILFSQVWCWKGICHTQ